MTVLVERCSGSCVVAALLGVVIGCSGSNVAVAPATGGGGGGGEGGTDSGSGGSPSKGSGGVMSSTGGSAGAASTTGGAPMGGTANGGSGGIVDVGGGYSTPFQSTGLNDRLNDIAVDSRGYAIAVGGVDGTIALGQSDYAGGILIVRLDGAGIVQWGEVFGGPEFDNYAYGVAVGADDSFVVVGSYRTAVTFGAGTLDVNDAFSGPDAFVVRFDGEGNALWAKGYGSAPYDVASDVAVDAGGNVYVAGYVSGSVDFGGGMRTAGQQSPFVLKLDAQGNHLFSAVYPCTGTDRYAAARAVGVDGSGNIWLSGYFGGSVAFGGGVMSRTEYDLGIFLVGLDSAGTHAFSTDFGDAGLHFGNSLLVHPDGSLLLAGHAVGTIDFGAGVHGEAYPGDTMAELFAARFTAGHAISWSTTVAGTEDIEGWSAAIDPAGNYWVAGGMTAAADVYGSPLLVSFDPAGAELDRRHFDADGGFSAMAIDGGGTLYAVGSFASSADFGFGPITGENDAVVVKLPAE